MLHATLHQRGRNFITIGEIQEREKIESCRRLYTVHKKLCIKVRNIHYYACLTCIWKVSGSDLDRLSTAPRARTVSRTMARRHSSKYFCTYQPLTAMSVSHSAAYSKKTASLNNLRIGLPDVTRIHGVLNCRSKWEICVY